MTGRQHAGRLLGPVLGSLIALGVAGGASGASITDPPPDPLEGPFADGALLLDETAGQTHEPRLLVLRAPAVDQNGTIRVAVLERDRGTWRVFAEQALPTGVAGTESGFIVPLSEDRFVVIASDPTDVSGAILHGLTVYRHQVSVWARRSLAMQVDAVGAADTDGDGVPEIAALGRADDLCGGATIRVLDGATLDDRRTVRVAGYQTGAGVLGRFDGDGAGLALGVRRCADGSAASRGMVLVSLSSGTVTALPAGVGEADASRGLGPERPLAVDVDGDGRDELLTSSGGSTALRMAGDGWRAHALASSTASLAAIGDGRGGLWLAGLDGTPAGSDGAPSGAPPMRLRHLAIDRTGAATAADGDLTADVRPSANAFTAGAIGQSRPFRPATGEWAGDVDGDGCRDLLVARLTLLCARDGRPRIGPGWYATTPLGAFDAAGSRRLLVAGTSGWPSVPGLLAAPTPAGVLDGLRWRDAPSPPFLLSEIAVEDLLYHHEFPVPAVSLGRAQESRERLAVSLGGHTGQRFFVRTIGLSSPLDPGPHELATQFLAGVGSVPGERSMRRIPVAPGAAAGAGDGFTRLELAADVAAHQVTAVGINDWGEVSPIEEARIDADRIGPTLVVQAPATSLPWPFLARIEGVADPGAMVRIGDGKPVEATGDGHFAVRTMLAPWPQTLTLRAVDPAGNESTQDLSVVGGVDYRRLPWEVILGAGVLVAAIAAALRSPGRLGGAMPPPRLAPAGAMLSLSGSVVSPRIAARSLRREGPLVPSPVGVDGEPVAVIEDLD